MQIGPNKKMIYTFFVFSIALCCYGVYDILNNPEGIYEISHFIPVKAWIIDTILIATFFISLYLIFWSHTTENKIIIDNVGLTLYDGRKIIWAEIEKVNSVSFNLVNMIAVIHLKNSEKVSFKWHQLDCGITKFIQEINSHI